MKTGRTTVLVLMLMVGLTLAAVLALRLDERPVWAQGAFPHAWGIEQVDSVGDFVSLALSPTAPYTPHISYAGDGLGYATHDGVSWVKETVDNVRVWGGTAIALDPAQPYAPSIAYYDGDSDVLKYARWTEGEWSAEPVDNVGDNSWGISLALEPTPPYTPHIAYIGYGNLKYAHWTGSGWTKETVDYKSDSFWTLESPSLALLPSAPYAPLISYHDTYGGYVKLARRETSGWTSEDVVYSMNSSGYASLALDSSGDPRIAYNEWSNWYLRYARWTGTTWDIEIVDSSGQPALALDSDDRPRIGYISGDELRYAYRSDGGWTIETVEGLDDNPWVAPSLALDGNGYPRISYAGGGLKYAYYYILTYSVSGQVTDSVGEPLAGVTVSAGPGGSTTTDTDGNYTIPDLTPGTYTLTASKAGCLFTPSPRIVSVPPDATGQDFEGRCEFDITGQVTDGSRNPFARVQISAGLERFATTDANGQYTFTGFLSGTYSLMPILASYVFQPTARMVSVPPDATGQNFVILPGPVSTTLSMVGTASLPASLMYTDTQSLATTLQFPAGAVTETTTLTLTPTLATGGAGSAFAGHAFEIAAYQGDQQLSVLGLNKPATVTIQYSGQDVRLVSDEGQLALWWWTDSGWEDAANTCDPPSVYNRDLVNRVVSVPICHLSLFSLLGPTHRVYLPVVLRGH